MTKLTAESLRDASFLSGWRAGAARVRRALREADIARSCGLKNPDESGAHSVAEDRAAMLDSEEDYLRGYREALSEAFGDLVRS